MPTAILRELKMDLPLWNYPGFESVDVTLLLVLAASALLLVNPVI